MKIGPHLEIQETTTKSEITENVILYLNISGISTLLRKLHRQSKNDFLNETTRPKILHKKNFSFGFFNRLEIVSG